MTGLFILNSFIRKFLSVNSLAKYVGFILSMVKEYRNSEFSASEWTSRQMTRIFEARDQLLGMPDIGPITY